MKSQVEFGPKSGPTVFQTTEPDGINFLRCSGGFQRSEVIPEIIQSNFQRANIDSLSCKHLISLEQLMKGPNTNYREY